MSTSSKNISIADQIERLLPSMVKPKRFRHIQCVVQTAVDLAGRFNLDVERVRLAALAHDMDRDVAGDELLRFCDARGVSLTDYERSNPKMIHGPVSAYRLLEDFGLNDQEVINAVRYHTLGEGDLGAIGLTLFAADFLEPNRTAITDEERRAILSGDSLEMIVLQVIETAQRRYGRLAEPTRRLYARLTKERGRESTP